MYSNLFQYQTLSFQREQFKSRHKFFYTKITLHWISDRNKFLFRNYVPFIRVDVPIYFLPNRPSLRYPLANITKQIALSPVHEGSWNQEIVFHSPADNAGQQRRDKGGGRSRARNESPTISRARNRNCRGKQSHRHFSFPPWAVLSSFFRRRSVRLTAGNHGDN